MKYPVQSLWLFKFSSTSVLYYIHDNNPSESKKYLEAAGWRIAKSGIPDPINLADWYAWNPTMKSARDCCSNKKPPVVLDYI